VALLIPNSSPPRPFVAGRALRPLNLRIALGIKVLLRVQTVLPARRGSRRLDVGSEIVTQICLAENQEAQEGDFQLPLVAEPGRRCGESISNYSRQQKSVAAHTPGC